MDSNKNNKGFIALTSVVLITSILTLIIISISIQSIDEAQISQAYEKSKQAQYDTQSCFNDVMLSLLNNPSYSRNGKLEINHNDYNIICENAEIKVTGENIVVSASSQKIFMLI